MRYNVPAGLAALRTGQGGPDLMIPRPHTVDIYYRQGAEHFIGTTNHEEVVYFVGMTRDQVESAAARRAAKPGEPDEEVVGGTEGIAMLISERGGCS